MIRQTLFVLVLVVAAQACAKKLSPAETYNRQAIEMFQKKEQHTYADALNVFGDKTYELADFPFYAIDTKYVVEAKIVKTLDAKVFEMPTSGTKTPLYKEYGKATFTLDGEMHTLTLYENVSKKGQADFEPYLFLPFHDATNGEQTYGGGRYLDFPIPTGNTLLLDFNKCYNPYCAYSDKFNCPITPRENTLSLAIEAGMLYSGGH